MQKYHFQPKLFHGNEIAFLPFSGIEEKFLLISCLILSKISYEEEFQLKIKIKEPFNLIVFIVGLVFMVVSIVFLRIELISLSCSAIGGSIIATVIVNSILIHKWRGLPIPLIAEAMASKVKFIRRDQWADLIFEIDNGLVRLKKRHKYSLDNPYHKVSHTLSMFTDSPKAIPCDKCCFQVIEPTDASKAIPCDKCGFQLVIEPGGKELTGENLKPLIEYKNGKHNFRNKYDIKHGYQDNQFEFHSVVYYRLIDRLIWTVQELSDGFNIQIINKTGIRDPFEVKINHHRERDIPDKPPIKVGDEYIKRIDIE